MENNRIHHPQSERLNQLEEIKKQARIENNREKFEKAQSEIKSIIKTNEFKIPDNFKELPIENQKDIIQIKINEAVVLENSDIQAYWRNVLKNLENNVNNNSNQIEKTITGEKSKLTSINGKVSIESDYLNIGVNSNNNNIKQNLQDFLITIALADIGKTPSNMNEEYLKILKSANNDQDIEDLKAFSKSIRIGSTGEIISELMNGDINRISMQNTKSKEENDTNITESKNTTGIDIINKNKELLDMQLDDLQQAKAKDPNDFRILANKYKKLITEIDSLSLSDEERKETQRITTELEGKIDNIKHYAELIEESANTLQY